MLFISTGEDVYADEPPMIGVPVELVSAPAVSVPSVVAVVPVVATDVVPADASDTPPCEAGTIGPPAIAWPPPDELIEELIVCAGFTDSAGDTYTPPATVTPG